MNKDQGRAVWRESIEKYGKETYTKCVRYATSSNPMRISKAVTDATGCKLSEQWRNTSC